MGTRADFYVGRGEQAEWLGSVTWDGYPGGIDETVFEATAEDDYRAAVAGELDSRDEGKATYPSEPWPWPWENSQTTDYAYAFEGGTVYASNFGQPWFAVDLDAEDGCCGQPAYDENATKVPFPDMSARKGDRGHIMSRSGLIAVSMPVQED